MGMKAEEWSSENRMPHTSVLHEGTKSQSHLTDLLGPDWTWFIAEHTFV